jgi:hypothetical protein
MSLVALTPSYPFPIYQSLDDLTFSEPVADFYYDGLQMAVLLRFCAHVRLSTLRSDARKPAIFAAS